MALLRNINTRLPEKSTPPEGAIPFLKIISKRNYFVSTDFNGSASDSVGSAEEIIRYLHSSEYIIDLEFEFNSEPAYAISKEGEEAIRFLDSSEFSAEEGAASEEGIPVLQETPLEVDRFRNKVLSLFGIKEEDLIVLTTFLDYDGLSVNDLSEELDMDVVDLSRVMQIFHARGYVEQLQDESEEEEALYSITLEGRDYLDKFFGDAEVSDMLDVPKDAFRKDILPARHYDITHPYADLLRVYLDSIDRCAVSPDLDRHLELGKRLQEGCKEARRKFIESNLHLVVWVAQKYQNDKNSLDFLDLIQVGNEGLIRSVDRYDPELGYKIATYAIWLVRKKINRVIPDEGFTIRIPVYRHEQIMILMQVEKILFCELGREPTHSELIDKMSYYGLSPEVAEKILKASQMHFVPIDAPLKESSSEYIKRRHSSDLVPTVTTAVPNGDASLSEDEIIDKMDNEMFVREILEDENFLSPQERRIIAMRFGLAHGKDLLYDDHILQEIGDDYGVSRERIRQIEKKALGKIRRRFIANHMDMVMDSMSLLGDNEKFWLNDDLIGYEKGQRKP